LSDLVSAVKKTLQAQERDDKTREQWLESVLKLAGDKFVFFDEVAGWLGMTRLYARIQGGGRIYDTAPKKRKGKVSLLAAITAQGMNADACLIHEGSVDTLAFLTYIEQVLLPSLEPGQIVIMDNFTIHHNAQVKTLIESKGCQLLYLPTYSPDFNPIEHLFAKLKAFIRSLRPSSVVDLIQAFKDAVLTITKDDASNSFIHCGYLSQ
jgi:transposase